MTWMDTCLLCRAEPWIYRSACLACQVRFDARMGPRYRKHVVAGLQAIEQAHGRAKAESVRNQALNQRRRG